MSGKEGSSTGSHTAGMVLVADGSSFFGGPPHRCQPAGPVKVQKTVGTQTD